MPRKRPELHSVPSPGGRPAGPGGPASAAAKKSAAASRAGADAAASPSPLPSFAALASAASPASAIGAGRALRIGVGGPVGAGKTTLVAGLCRALRGELSLAVVSNDTHAQEDAEALEDEGVLEPGRFTAVRAGCTPQAAIRDDIAANLEAVEGLEAAFAPLDLVLIEGEGADLSAVFSRGLIDRQIFVIDAAAGGRTPRKGGAGITDADLLLVNKTDLAPHVGADLEQMRVDASARRAHGPGGAVRDTPLPTLFTSLAEHPQAPAVADWVRELIAERRASVAA